MIVNRKRKIRKEGNRETQRERVSNYRTPSVSKPLFYLTLPVAEKREAAERGGEED